MPGKSRALQDLEEAQRELTAPPPQGGASVPFKALYAARCKDFAMLGLTHERMAELLGIDIATFNTWRVEHPSLRLALLRGGEMADADVAARGLYRRAVGMTIKKKRVHKDKDGQVLETIETTEELPPETNAGALWLSNRQRGKWRAANAGAENGPAFDLGSFVQAIGQAVAQAQARPGDDAKPVDLLDTVSTEPKG